MLLRTHDRGAHADYLRLTLHEVTSWSSAQALRLRVLSEDEIEWVEEVRLSDIIRANTPITSREIRNEIFRYKRLN